MMVTPQASKQKNTHLWTRKSIASLTYWAGKPSWANITLEYMNKVFIKPSTEMSSFGKKRILVPDQPVTLSKLWNVEFDGNGYLGSCDEPAWWAR